MFIRRKILIILLVLNAIVLSIFLYVVMSVKANMPSYSMSTDSFASADSYNNTYYNATTTAQEKYNALDALKEIGSYDSSYLLVNGWHNAKYNFTFAFDRALKASIEIDVKKEEDAAQISLYDLPYTSNGGPSIAEISIDHTFNPDVTAPYSFSPSVKTVEINNTIWYVDAFGERGCVTYVHWHAVSKDAYVRVVLGNCYNDETIGKVREAILGDFTLLQE